eukprot:COSAG01_NODE_46445_length_400_cov_0.837209_1_plen_45_part_10
MEAAPQHADRDLGLHADWYDADWVELPPGSDDDTGDEGACSLAPI